MLDHEGRLGLCPTAARRQHLGKATPPGAGGQISHLGHSPNSGTVGIHARSLIGMATAEHRDEPHALATVHRRRRRPYEDGDKNESEETAAARDEGNSIPTPPHLQLRLRRRLPAGRQGFQGGHRMRRGGSVRDPGIQPLDSRRTKECDRLGESLVRQELILAQTNRGDRDLAGLDGTAIAQQQLKSVLSFGDAPQMNAFEASSPASAPTTAK